jgi:tetratricopeptide (TPR) repeat protein
VREAIVLLKRALAINPSYAPAAGMIGWCRGWERLQGWGPPSDIEVAEAVRLAKQAIQEHRDDPDVLSMAANTISFFTGDHATAADAIERALSLNPNSAYVWLASAFLSYRRHKSGPTIVAFKHAMRLSPLDPLEYVFTGGVAALHVIAGRYEEAIEWADRSLRVVPRYESALRNRVIACAHLGHIEEAHEWLSPDPSFAIAQARLAMVHAMHEAVRSVDLVFHAAGTNAIYTRNPLERYFRDIHVAVQHNAAFPAQYESAGKVLMGLRPSDIGW